MPSIGIGIGLWRSNGTANAPPTVAITSPAGGATVYEGKALTITGTCADADGTIASVEVFAGVTSLGAATLVGDGTWTRAWTPSAAQALAGSASLTAVATDNGGLTTTSAAVAVTVGTWIARLAAATTWAQLNVGDTVLIDAGNIEAGDQITQWTGRVSARHLTQVVQDNEPTWTQTVGGDWYASFDNDDGTGGDYLDAPAATCAALSAAATAFFLVVWRTSESAGQYVFSFGSNLFALYYPAAGMRFCIGTVYGNSSAPIVGADMVTMGVFDGNRVDADAPTQNALRMKVWKNNIQESLTFSGNIPSALGSLAAGRVGANSATGIAPLDGRVYAIGWGAVAPDDAARNEIYAALQYGLDCVA